MKDKYIRLFPSFGIMVFISILFLITLSALCYSYPEIPRELRLKEYYYKEDIMPEWMIYDQKIRSLPHALYKNLRRKTTTFYVNGTKKYSEIYDYNKDGFLIRDSRGTPSSLQEMKSYDFGSNGLVIRYFQPGVDGLKGFNYHYNFDKYNKLIRVWTDYDEKGTSVEYINDYECVEYPNRGDHLTKRIKWNKEGLILYCDEDNHYGERNIYKYDEKSRVAFSITFSKYDTTRIDSAFYNQNLNLVCHNTYYKDRTKTGKLELYSSYKDEYVYDSNGYLTAEYNYNAAGQLESKHAYEHNITQGYKEYVHTTYFPISKTITKHIERYNHNNQLLWECDWTDFSKNIIERVERNLYSDTLLVEKEVKSKSYSYSEKYKYDNDGNLIETISFDNNGKLVKRGHTFNKNEITKDQFGRIISIKKFKNSELILEYAFEYYNNEIKPSRSDESTCRFNWYIILGVTGIFSVIAFFFYFQRKK
ncbi:MAG: hypothetical protein Q8933_18255 [Bacteroidota bacterium]|nr:hypothetical protein [Bacteroidota bacterium]MDP4197135.1 hypothetical protein [Bacteroidota bacterium]